MVEPAVVLLGCTLKVSAVAAEGVTVSVSVCVTATPLIVAEMTFWPTSVALALPVAAPLALVPLDGGVTVTPPPVAPRTTVAPGIGLSKPSRAVTVIVAVLAPPDAVMVVGAVTRDECVAETAAGSTVTVAVCVTATPLIVALRVLTSATVDERVPVATPAASVGPAGGVSKFPVPVAPSTTVAPETGLPLASFAVTVTVEAPGPVEAVITPGVADTVERLGEMLPATMLNGVLVVAVRPVAVAARV